MAAGMSRLDHFPTLPELLKEQGYTNIMVGKTHFGDIPASFDVVVGKEHNSYLADLGYNPKDAYVHPTPVLEEHYRETYLVRRAIEEMEKVTNAGDGPFFAFCSMPAPHPPETPPEVWATIYDSIPLPPLNYVPGEEQHQPAHTRRLLGISAENQLMAGESKTEVAYWREAIGRIIEMEHIETINQVRRLYYGYAAYCDAQVGRLLDYLMGEDLEKIRLWFSPLTTGSSILTMASTTSTISMMPPGGFRSSSVSPRPCHRAKRGTFAFGMIFRQPCWQRQGAFAKQCRDSTCLPRSQPEPPSSSRPNICANCFQSHDK